MEKLEGTFRRNEKGYGFVTLEDGTDLHIDRKFTKDAFDGDTVLVKLRESKGLKMHAKAQNLEGAIIKVIKRNKTTLVGLFQKSRNFAFVIPDNKNLCKDIFISKKNFKNAKNNQKVVVEIIKYPEAGKKAEGKVIQVLGGQDQAGVDMLSIIKDFDLPYEFPEEVLKEARSYGEKVNPKEIPERKDLRGKEDIFTIDGEDSKDLDDAIAVKKLENGNYKLDVHIADVSHYVTENTPLDKEALKRGTSVYMLDRVIPMLPKELSNGICSLNAGEDRFTLSISMEINDKGKVVSSEIFKGIINVTERMNYHDVQKILDRSDEDVVKRYEKYLSDFDLMAELAHILKNRRLEKGYLNLDIPESQIILDENGKVLDIKKYETSFSNEIIEQFMLTANESIAEKFYWLKAPFIYRVHDEPDTDKIRELNKLLFNFGYVIHYKEDKVYPTEFSKILTEIKGKPEEKIISSMILRTLKLAIYDSENRGHFGIASKYYCHFTSPIRRYPDLFIHRIISKYLANNYTMPEDEKEKYQEIAEIDAKKASEREKIATEAERDSIDMKKAEFMLDKIGQKYDGIISSVTQFGVFVELENTVEGLIRFENLGHEYYEYDESKRMLIGAQSKETFKIGDKIKIEVISANKQERKIDFARIEDDETGEIDEE